MGLITIGFFHWLIVYEFQSYVIIRQSYLLSQPHKDSVMAKTLLISNVPPYLQNHEVLKTIFQVVPGGIKDIWDINEFEIIDHQVEIAQDALHYLEKSQVLGLKNITIKGAMVWIFSGDSVEEIKEFIETHEIYFYPPLYLGPIRIPQIERTIRITLPGWLRIFCFQNQSPCTSGLSKPFLNATKNRRRKIKTR